jgi:hypothetical protein
MTREAGTAVEATPAKALPEAARRGWFGNPRFSVPYTNTVVVAAAAASIAPTLRDASSARGSTSKAATC